MKKVKIRLHCLCALSGIAASATIVFLLVAPTGLVRGKGVWACLGVALLSLASGIVLARERFIVWPPPGEVLVLLEFGLTRRERDLALMLFSGMSMKEISMACHLPGSTVRNCFRSIYAKLNVSGYAGLMALGACYLIE